MVLQYFQGVEKGRIGNKWINVLRNKKNSLFILFKSNSISFEKYKWK